MGINPHASIVEFYDKETMAKRLAEVDDDPHIVEYFHPLFLSAPQRELTGVVVLMIIVADMYADMISKPEVRWSILAKAEAYIDAVMVDVNLAEHAKAIWRESEAAKKAAEF
jgi:hypothetical protein